MKDYTNEEVLELIAEEEGITTTEVERLFDDSGVDESDYLCVYYLMDNQGMPLEDAINGYDGVQYYSLTMEDIARDMVASGCYGSVDDSLSCYIDYERLADDLSIDYTETDYGIFRSN